MAFNRAKQRAIKYGSDWKTGISREVFLRLATQLDCGICGKPLGTGRTLDHIVPLSRGGPNRPDNLQAAHGSCNSRKHNRLTSEAGSRGSH